MQQQQSANPDRLESHRAFYARLMAARAGVAEDSPLAEAFRTTPRERFVGGPPFRILARHGFVEAPNNDPVFLYQDVVVSLGIDRLNNGEPSLHAMCIATLHPQSGDHIVHVGAGAGYYTTILAKLVGADGDSARGGVGSSARGGVGHVDAYEIEPALARRAADNLGELPHVRLHERSGAEPPLPECDILYVNAGATAPLAVWLDALKPGGRLLFPLTAQEGSGAMLFITRTEGAVWPARFLFQAQFVGCIGARDRTESRSLAEAFRHHSWHKVQSLHRDNHPDQSCWAAGNNWWLSTASPPASPGFL